MPLFALANAGIAINASFLARAYTSPVTLGILIGYVVGKPVGTAGTRVAGHQAHPRPAAPAGRLGGGRRRRHDRRHRLHGVAADRLARLHRHRAGRGQARHPVRALVRATGLTWLVFRGLEPAARPGPGCGRCSARAMIVTDLAVPVDPERDHIRGPRRTRRSRWSSTATSSARTAARPSPRSASCCASTATLRYVWRHLPLTDVHPHAQLAAEARRGRRPAGRVLGDARPADGPPGRADLHAT